MLMLNPNSNGVRFGLGNGSVWTVLLDTTGDYILTGTWHHIMCTWDGTIANIYIDGVNRASCNWSGTLGTNDVALGIGAYSNDGVSWSDYFNGVIDEVAIYNRALSASEFKAYHTVDTNQDGEVVVRGKNTYIRY